MNKKYWNDIELTGTLQFVHRQNSLIDIYHRNGQLRLLMDILADIQAAAQKAQWRLIELDDQKRKEPA